jgi:2'-5' RNA ligase
MYKIAAFINFDKTFANKVSLQKHKIRKLFGKQIYLDHPVHLTLFTLNIKKITSLRNIYNKTKINDKKKLEIKINSTGMFVNDPLTNGHTLFYGLKKNPLLKSIQMKHLKKINKNIKVLKKNSNIFKSPILKKNYDKYGFPFAGKIWIPHITLASLRKIDENHSFIKNFLKIKIDQKFLIKNIEFYKISKNKHHFLFKTSIT